MKLKHSLLIFISLLIFPSSGYAGDLTDAVVKVFVTRNSYDYYRPWQSRGVSTTTGSGSVISGNRILTNAHVAADQTFIQVRKNSDPRKYTARLEAIGHDCDLAILRVDDPEFFEGVDPIELGDLPTLQSTVVVLGYPQGGDKLSITEGVVSRVELTAYSQSARQLLAVQIDAAINPGNSGGPVIRDGKMVGVAMQVLNSGQNIGYMIPVPIIEHFFEDLGDKKFDGFPFLGIEYHTTENPTLRKYHKMEKNDGGVIVTRTLPYSPADNILQENDIILEIDGVPIAQDGTFKFRQNERLAMTHLVTQKQIGDNLSLTILRDGTKKKIKIGLTPFSTLVHPPNAFEKPPYYIHGGLVFTVLSTDLLKAWGGRWWEQAPGDFTYYLAGSGRLN
ncbi:MAG: trypsin-like peptidase domain-containing protein, partial [Candidatus Omnitrophica bacterium]|nr:trypsin-like peptidase domain-containing protein [Candidatus Omnitrophota bacterium]